VIVKPITEFKSGNDGAGVLKYMKGSNAWSASVPSRKMRSRTRGAPFSKAVDYEVRRTAANLRARLSRKGQTIGTVSPRF
jgi:hypothetical protein